jgi:hypothetical protein
MFAKINLFVNANSHLTTKPFKFGIKCQSQDFAFKKSILLLVQKYLVLKLNIIS